MLVFLPTGAVLLNTLCCQFTKMPLMKLLQVGHGAGTADLEIPNILRIFIGQLIDHTSINVNNIVDNANIVDQEQVAIIETNIDDMNPQILGHLISLFLAQGAKDVFLGSFVIKL
ncbi:MAG: LarC family nickel insertion protein [bacterium]|nr:LarC family nickel insertion protein [bacterium]